MGNLTKAAQNLYISQPALSKFIKNLENSTGIKIFEHCKGKLTLTDSGLIYLNASKMIVDIYDKMELEIKDMDAGIRGTLKIGITTFRGSYLLPKVLPSFYEKYPNFEILLIEEDSKVLENLLYEGEVDVIIIKLPFIEPNFSYLPLYSEELLVSVPPKIAINLTTTPKPGNKYPWIDLHLLKDELFILLKPGHRTRDISENILKESGIIPKKIIQTDNIETALKLSIAGLGITFIPELYTINDYKSAIPIYFSIGSPKTISEFVIAYRKGQHLTTSTKKFIDIVTDYCHSDQF